MGCNCSSDYSDSEWIENLDEICEHCNCPISPQSCNPVSVYGQFVCAGLYLCLYVSVHCSVWMCVSEVTWMGFGYIVWLNVNGHLEDITHTAVQYKSEGVNIAWSLTHSCCVNAHITTKIILYKCNVLLYAWVQKSFYNLHNCEGSCLLCVWLNRSVIILSMLFVSSPWVWWTIRLEIKEKNTWLCHNTPRHFVWEKKPKLLMIYQRDLHKKPETCCCECDTW